jgi:branched-chain amino acid transport system permease protein
MVKAIGKGLVIASIIGLLVAIPLFTNRTDVLDLLFVLWLYIALAQSWNILGGFAGQVSLGHASFFGIGALATRMLWAAGTPFAIAFFGGGVAALILSCLIGIPALRLKGIYFAIGTLGLSIIMLVSATNIFPGVSFMPPEQLAYFDLSPRYYLGLVLAFATVMATYAISRSKIGLAMLAVRENEEAASASGINVFKYKMIALFISSFLAGSCGALFSYYYVSFYYFIPFELFWCFDPLLIVFIGGVSTVGGPIIGSVLFVVLRQTFALTMGRGHALIFGCLFIVTVLLLPKGIVSLGGRVRSLIGMPNLEKKAPG